MVARRKRFGTAAAALAVVALVPILAIAAPVALEAPLTGGATEVPDPGDPDATGAARVDVNVRKEKVCYSLVALDISLPATAAHIHDGAAGVAGPIVVTLKTPEDVAGTGIAMSNGCVKGVDRTLLRDIKNNPDEYYVNVHTGDFPGGAVRGQLQLV